MKKVLMGLTLIVAFVALVVGAAAPPDLAGTWELDKTKSQNLPRPWQGADSVILTISQNEKQVTLETKVTGGQPPGGGRGFGGGTMGPTVYNLDGTETTAESERGKSSSKAGWSKDGNTLELTVKRTFNTPNGEVTATTTEKLTLSADGKVLTNVRHTESPRGPQDSTLVYNKKS